MSLLDAARNKTGSSDATAWKPTEKGQGVEGIVTEISYRPSDFQADVNIPFITLLLDDGSKARVAGFHSVLRREIESEDPKIGDRMACVYNGTDTIKNGPFKGRPVHVYRCVVEHKGGAANPVTAETNEAPTTTTDDVPF